MTWGSLYGGYIYWSCHNFWEMTTMTNGVALTVYKHVLDCDAVEMVFRSAYLKHKVFCSYIWGWYFNDCALRHIWEI